MPSRIPEGGQRGWIIPIGGAEEKEDAPQILSRFVDLCGGDEADIVVIPSASQLRETGPRYVRLFRELGARAAESIDFDTRRDCDEPGRLERLKQATGVFFTGGNQLRAAQLLLIAWMNRHEPKRVGPIASQFSEERHHLVRLNRTGPTIGRVAKYRDARNL
jgi:cyanophycinase